MDMEDGYSSEDIDDILDSSLRDLRNGTTIVTNKDGTLRCPYSPSKKKQSYPYKDLLQHAEGVAKGKRGADAQAKHLALTEYLKKDLAGMATPAVVSNYKLDFKRPERRPVDDLRVYPWSGVVYNIDNSTWDGRQKMGPGVKELKHHFEAFHPDKVHVCWGPRGHLGTGVVTFRRCSEGLKDALAYEEYFINRGYGRSDWRRRQASGGLGNELYGWLARADDYQVRPGVNNDLAIAKYLQENYDLKDVGMVGAEKDKIQDQRFQSLAETVHERNKEYEILFAESEAARRNAEYVRQQIEEKHQKELEDVKRKAKQSADDHAQNVLEHNKNLQASMETLTLRCKELEDKEKYLVNEFDRRRLEEEMIRNRQQMDACAQQTDLQKEHVAKHAQLIREHQEQWRTLEAQIQNEKLKLQRKQQEQINLRFESERLDRQIFESTVKSLKQTAKENAEDPEHLKEKLKQMEAEREDIEQKLNSAMADNETNNEMINALALQQRTANDELEAARKVCLEALQELKHSNLKVKRMGELKKQQWKAACKKRFKNHKNGWEMICAKKLSKWEKIMSDHDFDPFKTVQVGNEDKWEKVVDPDNERLRELRKELGDGVCESVINAMKELNEWNASGRYPIPVAWNMEENRRATVEEVLMALLDFIKKLDPNGENRKRPAAAIG